MADSNKGMKMGKEKVTAIEDEKESTPKRVTGASSSFRMRRLRGSIVSLGNEESLTPSDSEVPPTTPNSVNVNVLDNHASEEAITLEAVKLKKEKLDRFLAPITCMCGIIAMSGVWIYLSLPQGNNLLEISTVIMMFCFFLFLLMWVLTWFVDQLTVLNQVERLFYLVLVILIVALGLAGVAML